MQLGARWRTGDPPHRSVPPQLYPIIAAQEAEYPSARSWTLTWLEGRPRCALEEAVTVTLDLRGEPVIVADGADGSASAMPVDAETDDDDWLQ